MKTKWYEIALAIGSISPDNPYSESGGDSYANKALELILGDEWIEDTVEYAISSKKGAELAMNCLRRLCSDKACRYAYNVYKTSEGERVQMAVWLIKHIANPISYNWVEEFLEDKSIIGLGLGVLDQLLWSEKVEYDDNIERLLVLASTNSDGGLDESIDFIRNYIKERNEREQES